MTSVLHAAAWYVAQPRAIIHCTRLSDVLCEFGEILELPIAEASVLIEIAFISCDIMGYIQWRP